ncbi:MAG: sodium:calcium antiporter [Anaerohalosphaeraceae bacterium]|jgi:cation:H+ antiporter
MLNYVLMAVGFVFVIKGADFLVSSASSLARRVGVSDLVIGLTAVAFGTSLPELFVNVTASLKGTSDIALGNIVGSNIANILLILGVSGVIFPLVVGRSTVWKEIPLSLLAAVLLGLLVNDRLIDSGGADVLSRIDGLVLLSFFVVFIYYSVGIAMQAPVFGTQAPGWTLGRVLLMMGLGLAGLIIGGKWVVQGAVQLALALGISQRVIGLTVVAVGTSLPELATSAVAAFRKKPELAIGNVVGSNIFNIFFILGISAVIRPIDIGLGANRDIGAVILASILLFAFMFTGKRHKLDRWEAALFVAAYIGYVALTVVDALRG